jgi:hypothetical protein
MPVNTPPFGWGPASFDERDLDNLLSGRLADTPPALRQVADALIALNAAPAPAEMAGEAAIMAEFSALAGLQPSGHGDASPGGQAHTLVLPVPPPGVARKRGARHRGRRRRTGRPAGWQAGALLGVAAAAAIVMIIAFGGILPSPIKSRAHTPSPLAARASVSSSGSQNVAAKSAAPVPPSPSHRPATHPATAQSPQGRTLCRTWFADFGHPQPHSKWAAEWALFTQISKLAGGPGNVFMYCRPVVQGMFPHRNPWFYDGDKGSRQGDQGGSGNNDSGSDGSGITGSSDTGSGGTGPAGQGPGTSNGNGKPKPGPPTQ